MAMAREDVKEAKEAHRQRIWTELSEQGALKDYPPTCHNRIPHFKGSEAASYRFSKLSEFRRASCVKINPSLAQMKLRYLVLDQAKTLIVPVPSLANESGEMVFCLKLDGGLMPSQNVKRKASTKAGALKHGTPLLTDWESVPKIDVFVVGSVAVSPKGVRLGKGTGYGDLEWAILTELGVVSDKTIVATTVHDSQVVDLPVGLMCDHDLPVDLIVTPTRIINVRKKLPKPREGVLWDTVDEETCTKIPILQLLKRTPHSIQSL